MLWRLTLTLRWSRLHLQFLTAQSHRNYLRIHHHYVRVTFFNLYNHYQCFQVQNGTEEKKIVFKNCLWFYFCSLKLPCFFFVCIIFGCQFCREPCCQLFIFSFICEIMRNFFLKWKFDPNLDATISFSVTSLFCVFHFITFKFVETIRK